MQIISMFIHESYLYRPAEFLGNTRVLFRDVPIESFLNLRMLNLYDNELESIQVCGLQKPMLLLILIY